VVGALIGLVGIFLRGMLVLLGTALFRPLWTGSIHFGRDAGVVLIGLPLLILLRARPVLVVILGALAGIALELGNSCRGHRHARRPLARKSVTISAPS
jgi:hypothetical protein